MFVKHGIKARHRELREGTETTENKSVKTNC